ncbi:hypothetical protein APUTEX25_001536 [Auxenochlorella protothecoides]|uniref:J domain-containing protein n=1 Tax=Auxenochlorella protothecoides TaxID=3075 RepID=A0A3M7KSS1_AUXPR|nr:hypothetical protein APUTEX25_001536 [Auxenochlorella protothecoides]|eukprot:RMZ52146.1 hypothetical protein APUTEX25_001536 [Auxenochlorella protothecoides]
MAAASSHTEDQSLYAALGVGPTASEDDIRRAYRALATSLHPDKTQDPERRDDAAQLFTIIQEAYEVLSNPDKRDIYDVYGKEGLAAGLELGERVKNKDDLRKEWEQFRERQETARIDSQVNYRGAYIFRADASALVKPYSKVASRIPELTTVYMTSGVDIPVDTRDWGVLAADQDIVHLGGLVNVRKNVGGGSFLAGYKRVYSDYTTLDVNAAVGLKSLFSVSSGVQLSPHAQANLTATWQPDEGVGLQLVTTRQLSKTLQGEYSWVIGPETAAGMSLGITRRMEKLLLTGRVEVGAVTGFVGRVARRMGEKTTARAGVRLGPASAEVDVGGQRTLSELATGGLSIVTGPQGIVLKLRYNRAGHMFEFPILLSPLLDWNILAAAYCLPPLLYYVGKEWVVGPLARGIQSRRLRLRQQEEAATIRAALAQAAAAAQLLGPVAERRAQREASQDGLVIALALYGASSEVEAEAARRISLSSSAATEQETEATSPRREPAVGVVESTADEQESGMGPGGSQEPSVPVAANPELEERPPSPVADVTVAVQYLVEAGKAVFHKGYTKAGLIGFCDPAPGTEKTLLVLFSYRGRCFRATLADTEGGILPARGDVARDGDEAAFIAAAPARWR